jgi:hypothetical protein
MHEWYKLKSIVKHGLDEETSTIHFQTRHLKGSSCP